MLAYSKTSACHTGRVHGASGGKQNGTGGPKNVREGEISFYVYSEVHREPLVSVSYTTPIVGGGKMSSDAQAFVYLSRGCGM